MNVEPINWNADAIIREANYKKNKEWLDNITNEINAIKSEINFHGGKEKDRMLSFIANYERTIPSNDDLYDGSFIAKYTDWANGVKEMISLIDKDIENLLTHATVKIVNDNSKQVVEPIVRSNMGLETIYKGAKRKSLTPAKSSNKRTKFKTNAKIMAAIAFVAIVGGSMVVNAMGDRMDYLKAENAVEDHLDLKPYTYTVNTMGQFDFDSVKQARQILESENPDVALRMTIDNINNTLHFKSFSDLEKKNIVELLESLKSMMKDYPNVVFAFEPDDLVLIFSGNLDDRFNTYIEGTCAMIENYGATLKGGTNGKGM